MWVSENGVDWSEVASISFGYRQSLEASPDGGFIAAGLSGASVWVSPDGIEWTEIGDPPSDAQRIAVEKGRILVARRGIPGAHIAEWDGSEFVTASPPGLLPQSEQWEIESMTTSDAVIAVLTASYGEAFEEEAFEESADSVAYLIASNGRLVELSEFGSTIAVFDDDVGILTLHTWDDPQDTLKYDIEANTLSFVDPETGEVLATVGVHEFEVAQQDLYEEEPYVEERHPAYAVLYSGDGVTWSVTHLDDGFVAQDLLIVGENVLVYGYDSNDNSSETHQQQVLVATP